MKAPSARLLLHVLAALCLLDGFVASTVSAQTPGSVDTSFAVGSGLGSYVEYGNTYAPVVEVVAVQEPGQKIIVGGAFGSIDGVQRYGLARLKSSGAVDKKLNSNFYLNGSTGVHAIAFQGADLILGGGFGSIAFNGHAGIARLNARGILDDTFTATVGATGNIQCVAVQPDGKVLVGGLFAGVSGLPRNSIARLNADGTDDRSFNPKQGVNSDVRALALQPDGKVVIVGSFGGVNNVARAGIARLKSNGRPDGKFNAGPGVTGALNGFYAVYDVFCVAIQPDGKIVFGGLFNSINGLPYSNIARLNADGSVDTSFSPGRGPNDEVIGLALESNGKIVICGRFTGVNGVACPRVARLNADGSLDTTFNPGSGPDNYPYSVAVQSDDKIIVGGGFSKFNGVTCNCIARLFGN